ncbi:50S ribosomal protein L11 methyltransferase [Weissella tructae]|uniref:Ribosomal protein L11 methyltransferase n=2 Tax=Weissella TaxID=46255 RepID=A0A075U519_9LACO|nr:MULTISPECIES: 50S ribosomal protein L11 methyltransferase [Weissella]AIG65232.1 Ribosomal protein L11 methyltransferase [Weissella tructae]AIM62545.1 Ribosomal protein L11 methyltransferase [Weissella ceti]AIM63881.1 Ribosomal protein L11 methyltransferase [Weissella ceti]ELA07632.1 ribosomal protein L11 methyltransferase [Weissella ceti NC36]QVV91610.1 50S ribosomal protein L11 methyltransferase [Weissella tructae]
MNWQEVTVTTQSESVEAISNILMEAGAEGIQIEDAADKDNYVPADDTVWVEWDKLDRIESGAIVSGFFPGNIQVREMLDELRVKVLGLKDFGLDPLPGTVQMADVKDEDWATEWQKYYHPVRITRDLTVVPKWEKYEVTNQDEKLIMLDPGLAFGTGTHPTTRLMLQALTFVMRGGERVLDVGTGSGVLAIAAKHLGADYVLGTDIDEVAVRSAQGNLDLNPVASDIDVQVSDLLKDVDAGDFNLVIANMLSEVLFPLIPTLPDVLVPGGTLLLSGIYEDKIEAIKALLIEQDYTIDEVMQAGPWFGVVARRVVED